MNGDLGPLPSLRLTSPLEVGPVGKLLEKVMGLGAQRQK